MWPRQANSDKLKIVNTNDGLCQDAMLRAWRTRRSFHDNEPVASLSLLWIFLALLAAIFSSLWNENVSKFVEMFPLCVI